MNKMVSYDSDSEEVDDTISQQDFSLKHALPPLDLSFKSLLSPDDLKEEIETHYQTNLTRSPTTKKFTCHSVRVNNNSLHDLAGFYDVIEGIVSDVGDIAWLDLSFNDLNAIDDEILKFTNLKVLYLHGNALEKIQDVRKLTSLSQLIILTLHGNPLETELGYRQFVLSLLPSLKSLDFSAVTNQDRGTASVWSQLNPKAFKRKRKTTFEEQS